MKKASVENTISLKKHKKIRILYVTLGIVFIIISIVLYLIFKNDDQIWKKGIILSHNEQFEEAITVFDGIIQKHPNSIDAYYGKLIALAHLQRPEDAMLVYKKIRTINDNFGYINESVTTSKILSNQGYTGYYFYEVGDFKKAVVAFEKTIAGGVADAEIFAYLGLSLNETGEYIRAISVFGKAIELGSYPASEIALGGRGFSYAYQGDFEKALGDFNQVFGKRADKGIILMCLGRFGEALEYLDGNIAKAYILIDMKKYGEAKTVTSQILKNYENHGIENLISRLLDPKYIRFNNYSHKNAYFLQRKIQNFN